MSFIRKSILLALVLLCNGPVAFADTPLAETALRAQINRLIEDNSDFPPEANVVQHVTILTPAAQLAALCTTPRLSIIGSSRRITGTKSISAQCGDKRTFIQIRISAEGKWWSAARTLKAGEVITAADIRQRSGSLARFPYDGALMSSAIIGQTATRTINKDQIIAQGQLRHSWAAVAGQQVDILAQGHGFLVRSRGKALSNAIANGPLKVTMGNGKTFIGTLSEDGVVRINLQE